MQLHSSVQNGVLSIGQVVQRGAGNRVGRRRWVSEAAQVAPASNTGALRTNDEDSCTLDFPEGFATSPTVDWLSFTIFVDQDEKQKLPDDRIVRLNEQNLISPSDSLLFLKSYLADYFGGSQPLEYGLNHYKCSCSILGTGRILWHPDKPAMGVHVLLKSESLSRYANISKSTIYDLLHDMADLGARFARVDLALDSDKVSIQHVIDAHEAQKTVTKAQGSTKIKDYKSGGETLNIGSRSGRRMVRFYDKAAEQGVDGVWTRCEVELKQEHAQTAVESILAGHDAREILLSSVDFRELDNTKVDRRSRCSWWQDWVEVTERITFPIKKKMAAVADAMAWIMHQVSPTLAFLSMYMGNTYWLDELIEDAAKKVPGWRWDLLPNSV